MGKSKTEQLTWDQIDQLSGRKRAQAIELFNQQQLEAAMKENLKVYKPGHSLVVFDFPNIAFEVEKLKPKANAFKIYELPVQVSITSEAIGDIDNYDMVVANRIKEAANAETLKSDIAAALEIASDTVLKYDKESDGTTPKVFENDAAKAKALTDAFASAKASFEGAVDDAIEAAAERALDEVNKNVQVAKDRRAYKIESAVKVGMGVIGVITGVIGAATAPFSGPAAVIGVIGIVKGFAETVKQVHTLTLSAETVLNELSEGIISLQNTLETEGTPSGKVRLIVKELGGTTIDAFLGPATGTLFETVESCKGKSDTALNKINGVDMKSRGVGINLNNTLDAQKSAKKVLDTWMENNNNRTQLGVNFDVYSVKLDKLKKDFITVQLDVQELLVEVIALIERTERLKNKHAQLSTAINDFSRENISTGAKACQAFIKIAGATTYAVVGATSDAGSFNDVRDSVNKVNGIVGNVNDGLGGLMTLKDEIQGALT